MNKVKRYIILMVIGVLLNLGLYQVAHVFHLPAWIDSVGTAYVALALEPAAGLLVAFATNFYQAAVIYENSSIVYYVISAIAALSFGILLRKGGQIQWKRMGLSVVVFIVAGTVLGGLLTIWRTAGVPDSGWERHFYEMALGWGWNMPLACMFGTFVLKIVDGIILAVLIPVLYKITPKAMVTETLEDPLIQKS